MRWILLACCAGAALAQGTIPKDKPEEYEAHLETSGAAIGAEFMVRSFSGSGQTFIIKDFLVVEVALYPPKGESVRVDHGAFRLRLNGKNPAIPPQPATMVAAMLQHPEWQQRPRLEAGGGIGNTGVIIGRPAPTRIPGGQTGPTARIPPRAPTPDYEENIERGQPVRADELAIQTALPEGTHAGPVSGYLYFPFRGKPGSLKSVELLYGDAAIKLR